MILAPLLASLAFAAPADAPKRGELDDRRGRALAVDKADGCRWAEGEASVVVGEQDTKHQARAAAIEHARGAAVQDLLGVDVQSRFLDYMQEGLRKEERLTESLLQTTRNGRILKEQVLEEGYRDAPDCSACRYRVKLKACVAERKSSQDKDFRVELSMPRVRFVHGDDAALKVTATRDCTVYLYDVYDLGRESKTALVVPNELVAEKTLKAGETWEYPDADARKRGLVALKAELAGPDDEVSAETLRVVASRAPLAKSVYDPADGGWLGVLRRLHRSKVEWTDDAEAFTIYKR